MVLESIETKSLTVEDVIKEAKMEESELKDEIDLPKTIWKYEIKTSYGWFLSSNEKWFAIELSSENNLAIIVKVDKSGELSIGDKEGIFTLNDFGDETLDEWTESYDPYVNLINRAISSLWYSQLNKKESDDLLAAIETLKKTD